MPDLEGDEAFRLVLERLLSATSETKTIAEQRDSYLSEWQESKEHASLLDNIVTELKRQREAALPILAELYVAADDGLMLYRINRGTTHQTVSEADLLACSARLAKALAAARDYCDQPPF